MTISQKKLMTEAKDYLVITLGLLLYTFAWTVFLLPYEIVTGGVTGISAIVTMQLVSQSSIPTLLSTLHCS